jgi:hypothetical protein
MIRKMTIKELIDEIGNLDENLDVIFDCPISQLSDRTMCEVVHSDDIEADISIISIYQIVDIIENIKQQISNPSYKNIIDAIVFYSKNDAFIIIEKNE